MQESNGTGEAGTDLAIRDKGLLQKFAEMVTLVPSEDGGGAERILAQVLAAKTWDQLDDPWEASKAADLAGKVLRLDYAERRPSDFREGLGMFLVLHCVDIDSGESKVITTGAIGVIGQVVAAYAQGSLPLYVEFIVAARATERGYHPHHLKIHGSAKTAPAGEHASASA